MCAAFPCQPCSRMRVHTCLKAIRSNGCAHGLVPTALDHAHAHPCLVDSQQCSSVVPLKLCSHLLSGYEKNNVSADSQPVLLASTAVRAVAAAAVLLCPICAIGAQAFCLARCSIAVVQAMTFGGGVASAALPNNQLHTCELLHKRVAVFTKATELT